MYLRISRDIMILLTGLCLLIQLCVNSLQLMWWQCTEMPTCLIEHVYIYCFNELRALSCIRAVHLVGKQHFIFYH